MAQMVVSMSGVVLGGVVMVVGSNLARGKYLQHLSAQLIHYISVYIYIYTGSSFSVHFFIKYLYCLCFQLDQLYITVWNFFCFIVYVQCYE